MLGLATILTGIALTLLATTGYAAAQEPMEFATNAGSLRITMLGHGSLMIEYAGEVIYVDPYSKVTRYDNLPKADQIWITHEHYDHLDLAAINAVRTKNTIFVANAGSASQLPGKVTVMHNGDHAKAGAIPIEAVPAYNLVRERAPGQKYHPKGMGNGYIANFGDFRLYIAGDTEAIPEMAHLRNIDAAFLPVMLPYTMSPDEAVAAARSFRPKLVLPYHTVKTDAQAFAAKLQGSGITVRIGLP